MEDAVSLPGKPTDPAKLFNRYEEVAIQILDSKHMDFNSGVLEEYLMDYLYSEQLELALCPK